MELNKKQSVPVISAQSDKDKGNSKKYIFYRKPSIKKKAPEVKQTITSYKRMLKANPLLQNEIEKKDMLVLSKKTQNFPSCQSKTEDLRNKNLQTEKQSLQPNFNLRKPLISKLQRSESLKNPPKSFSRPIKNQASSIISGSKQLLGRDINSTNVSRQSNVDFSIVTSKFLCSTPLEKNSKIPSAKNCVKAKDNSKVKTITQVDPPDVPTDKLKKNKPRRSLSAQHFDRKKGVLVKHDQKKIFAESKRTQSLENVSNIKTTVIHDISPIAEGSQESSMLFKTPSAYERRSICKFTPKSAHTSRRSVYNPATPLPSLNDLQKRLNGWLVKRGKSTSSFHHLKCFGMEEKERKVIDEENKENIEVDQNLSKGSSYEDLKIDKSNSKDDSDINNDNPLVLTEENAECVAKAALEDLLKLIQDGYSGPQCEGWLELIRQKYGKLEEEPQYWECRAAIEQSRGNITNAVQFYRTAIVQGAEIQSVDESLDILLQKFSLLNINTKDVDNEMSVKERLRIVRDARNVFKSSIIQFAVQERKLKKSGKIDDKKFVATPVRRSTRLSRSVYISTPGVKICSSLQELDTCDREMLDFKKNKALF